MRRLTAARSDSRRYEAPLWFGDRTTQLGCRFHPLADHSFRAGKSLLVGRAVSRAPGQLGDLSDKRLVFIAQIDNDLVPDHWAAPGLTSPVTYYHNVMVIMLGEFEYLLVSAAARLAEDAYGASIQQDMNESTGRRCSTGALYTTLDRLEAKGLIKTWMGDPTPQRGGRRKRMVRVTAKGVREAASFYNAVTRASRGVSWEASRVGSDP